MASGRGIEFSGLNLKEKYLLNPNVVAFTVGKTFRQPLLLKKQKGFKKYLLLTDRTKGKGMIIVLWNTEADMMTAKNSTWYKEHVAKLMPLATESATIEEYEVILQE